MKITSDETASAQLRLSWQKYRAWAFVAAATLVHLLIAARSVGPMYVFDEIGYVAGADVIAGQSADWSLCGSSYAVGYSATLAPLWWLPISPLVVYQIAVFISAALGALAMWPATALAKRFGASGGVALGIGALVTLIPARALMNNYVLAENPLTLLVLCAALVAFRLAHSRHRLDAVLLGAAAGLAAAMHARALPLVAVTLVWLIVRAICNRTRWVDAILGVVLALAFNIGGFVAQTAVGSRIFADDSRIDDLLGALSPVRLGEVILGQAFTQVVSWALLTALGLLACASKARAEVRRVGRQGVASAWWWLGLTTIAQGAFFVWVLASSADFDNRFDTAIFGRYLDPFVVPLAVLGAVTLWVSARERLTNAALAGSVIALAAYGILVVPRISPDALWIPFAVPGLVPFLDPHAGDHRSALAVAVVAAFAACVLLWLTRRRKAVGLIGALVVAAVVTLGADALRVDPFEADSRSTTVTSEYVLQYPERNVTLAADLLPCLERNKIQLELAQQASIVLRGGHYGDDLIVGPTDWPAAEAAGLRKILFTTWLEATVWTVKGG